MTWNIFKRVAALEEKVKELMSFSDDSGRIVRLEEKVKRLENKLFIQAVERNAFSAAPVRSEGAPVFTKDEVAREKAREKERKRQYHREWYAKRRVELKKARSTKEQKEKRAAYARAYYLRKKGEKNA